MRVPRSGRVDPRDVTQRLGDGVVRGTRRSSVYIAGASFSMSAPAQHAVAGVRQVVHHHAGADGGRVHPLEELEVFLALLGDLDAGHEAVVVQVVDRGGRHARRGQGARQAAPEADRRSAG